MNLRYEMYEFITENTISYIHLSKHYGRNEIVCICYEFDYSRNKKIHYRRCELIDVAFITLRNNLVALLETLYTGISFLDSRRSVFFHQ